MIVTQFQFEPTVTTHDFRYSHCQSRFASAGQSVHAAIDALMLGLRLRGWLTDDDKELLDRLAADNYLTFLIKGQKYLHPEGLDLFPLDLIRSAQPEAAEALFKHHYRPKADPHCGGYVIHSAFINEPSTEVITLGMFGGNRPSRQVAAETYFSELVERFRLAANRSEAFVREYGQIGESDCPVMIVDRCSGRLFYTNPATDTLLGESARSLVGREFHQISKKLTPQAAQYRWLLRNLDPEDRLYTIVSLEPAASSSNRPETESTAQFFVHKMRNKIAGITSVASHVRTLSAELGADEAREMAELIVNEAGLLNDLLGGLHVLFDYKNLPRRAIDASALFDEALDHEAGDLAGVWHIDNVSSSGAFDVNISVPALRSLFTSVLRAHFGAIKPSCSGRLSVRRSITPDKMCLHVSSGPVAPGNRPSSHLEWKQYSHELASTMSVKLDWEETNDADSLTTRIELNS